MSKILEGEDIIRWLDHEPTEMDATFALITASVAEILLSRNTKNRPEIKAKIKLYGADMARNDFPPTSSAVGFDIHGIVQNGQNRLRACAVSGVAFTTLLCKGLPIESFIYEDTHVKRTLADVLAITGEKNYRVLAGALSWMYRYQEEVRRTLAARAEGGGVRAFKSIPYRWDYGSNGELLTLLHNHPGLREAAAKFDHRGSLVTPGMMAPLWYLGCQINPDITDEFFDKILSGANITESEPVAKLIHLLQKSLVARDKMRPERRFVYTVKALRLSLNGNSVESLRVQENEEFPILEITGKKEKLAVGPALQTTNDRAGGRTLTEAQAELLERLWLQRPKAKPDEIGEMFERESGRPIDVRTVIDYRTPVRRKA